ncbi:MAG TPA: hypothetical protein VG477_13585 [Thermoanaerobaculia bacterium]|nr:hypothetical protein [Thermoanaerobaculia bacterium]
MRQTFQKILELVSRGEVRISSHGYDELAAESTRRQTKLLREGQLMAEVEVELIESDEGWAPYLSLEEAEKLDSVRKALRTGDVEAAGKLARVFRLMPVAV